MARNVLKENGLLFRLLKMLEKIDFASSSGSIRYIWSLKTESLASRTLPCRMIRRCAWLLLASPRINSVSQI